MITRNNVPRHNGTMTCLLGRSGLWKFRVITPRHGLLLHSSERKCAGAGGSQWKQWKSSGSSGRCREAGGRQGRGRKGCRRCGRGAEGREKVRKRQEGTGSNGMLQDLRICHSTCDIFVVTFLVTQLDPPVALVFGYTWFYCYNLLIDWYKGQILSFQTPPQVLKPTLIGPQLPELQPTDSEPIQPQSTPTGLLLPEPQPTNSVPPRPESPPSSPITPEVPKVEQPKPSISFINAAAYAC